MRKFIYIKLRQSKVEARIVGKTTDEVFSAKALGHPRTMAGDFEQLVELYKSIIEQKNKTPINISLKNHNSGSNFN